MSDNGGSFTLWQVGITSTSAVFAGEDEHTYGFFSVATDLVGYVQTVPVAAQASTIVVGESMVYLAVILAGN